MPNIPKNALCPCNSGKKYKRCCFNKNTSQNGHTLKFDFKSFMQEFDPSILLTWLQVICVYPENSLFMSRIEYLIANLLAIPEVNFTNKKTTRDDIVELFERSHEDLCKLFGRYEDYEGPPKYELIPFFFDKERYYLVDGGLERPYEYWKHYSDQFSRRNQLDNPIKEDFKKSLTFQTKLLKAICAEENKRGKTNLKHVSIPDNAYIEKISPIFITDAQASPDYFFCLGHFSNLTDQKLYDKVVSKNLFLSRFYIHIKDITYHIFPSCHINILIQKRRTLFKYNEPYTKILQANEKARLQSTLTKVFGYQDILSNIHTAASHKNLINSLTSVIFCDGNKLLFFDICLISTEEDLSKPVTTSILTLCKIVSELRRSKTITIVTVTGESMELDTSQIEILLFPIFSPITFNFFLTLDKAPLNNITIVPFSIMDLSMVLAYLDSEEDFIKFVRSDENLRRQSKYHSMGEFMDRFAYYLDNGKSYHRTGQKFDFYMFLPHMWSSKIHEDLHKRYHDEDVWLEIERSSLNIFNKVEKETECSFKLIDSSTGTGAYLVKISDRYIWIIMPYPPHLNREEYSIGYNILGMLFKEHICNLGEDFISYLKDLGLASYRYSILIQPVRTAQNSTDLDLLNLAPNSTDNENPLLFENRFKENDFRTFIYFDHVNCLNFFSDESNIGERYCLRLLLKSIAEQTTNLDMDSRVSTLVDKIVPYGKPRYGMKLLDSSNPSLARYAAPYQFNETDNANVEKKISEYLIKENIEPGNYINDEAIEIIKNLYKHLQSLLETEVSSYDTEAIIYIYTQLELAEGDRYKELLRLRLTSMANLDYDLVSHLRDNDNNQTVLIMSIRHLLHTSLKVSMFGGKKLNRENWTYLLSISKWILTFGFIRESVEYELHNQNIIVTPDYLIDSEILHENFDSKEFHTRDIKRKINNAKRPQKKSSNSFELHTKNFINDLNTVFIEELGFSYENLIFILYTFSSATDQLGIQSPIKIVNLEKAVEFIRHCDTQYISTKEIEKIIDFISMQEKQFDVNNLLYEPAMMRNKERITVSPVVKKDGQIIFGPQVCSNALSFWNNVSHGHLPCQLPNTLKLEALCKNIHSYEDKCLEENCINIAEKILGAENVEGNILNFKKLSPNFKNREDCGEIDLLCIDKGKNIIYVFVSSR